MAMMAVTDSRSAAGTMMVAGVVMIVGTMIADTRVVMVMVIVRPRAITTGMSGRRASITVRRHR